jgi:hypothetical protein
MGELTLDPCAIQFELQKSFWKNEKERNARQKERKQERNK